jgi:hypothetical protein
MIVMFLSGLWHGASNNFVMWGLLNGATMVGHKVLIRPLRFSSGLMERTTVTRVSYYYLCCWVTFCTIASINIFFRCPDWETAKSFARSIYWSGFGDYLAFFRNTDHLDTGLWNAFGWVVLVFLAHEAQRYFDVRSRILQSTTLWSVTCLAAFWWIVNFGITGPEFIYYQF